MSHVTLAQGGDSSVALNAAISGASGCLSIVELNLQSFEPNHWTARIRASRNALRAERDQLIEEGQQRHASQILQTERRTLFVSELQAITSVAKGKGYLPETSIKALSVRLQTALWKNKHWLWKNDPPENPFDVLNVDKALECFGLTVQRAATLGHHMSRAGMVEVAGEIDQAGKVVSISEQFPKETQNFTTAHELGHYLLHTQPVLHRDRPLSGLRVTEPRDSEEWQADKFASYFLMPTKLVRKTFAHHFRTEHFRITPDTAFALNERSTRALRSECKDLRGLSRLLATTTSYNGVHFHSLAARFQVSVEAMTLRLEELELLSF